MRVAECFPSQYLTASDFPVPATMTIVRYQLEKMPNSTDQKPVLYFQEQPRGLVLNVTNAKVIQSILRTDEMDRWQGGRIELYATTTDFGGKIVPCVRVRAISAVSQQAGIQQQPAVTTPSPPAPQQAIPEQQVQPQPTQRQPPAAQPQQTQQPLTTMQDGDSVPWA